MTKIVLIILTILFNNTAIAEWSYLGRPPLGDFYYDKTSINKAGDLMTVNTYLNIMDKRRTKPLSGQSVATINCKEKTFNITNPIYFGGYDLKGPYIGHNPNGVSNNAGFSPIPKGNETPIAMLYSTYCN